MNHEINVEIMKPIKLHLKIKKQMSDFAPHRWNGSTGEIPHIEMKRPIKLESN